MAFLIQKMQWEKTQLMGIKVTKRDVPQLGCPCGMNNDETNGL